MVLSHIKSFKDNLQLYLKDLQRYSRAYYKDTANTNDLVQETLLRALENQDQFQNGSNLKGWLFKIMRNIYLNDYKRKTKFRSVDVDDCTLSNTPDQEEIVRFHEVQNAFETLPLQERKILYLAGVEGLSYDEIATNMNIKAGTVKSRLNRARHDLQVKSQQLNSDKHKNDDQTIYHLPSLS